MYTIIEANIVEHHTIIFKTSTQLLFTTEKQAEDVACGLTKKTKKGYYVVKICSKIGSERTVKRESYDVKENTQPV